MIRYEQRGRNLVKVCHIQNFKRKVWKNKVKQSIITQAKAQRNSNMICISKISIHKLNFKSKSYDLSSMIDCKVSLVFNIEKKEEMYYETYENAISHFHLRQAR